MPRVLIYLKATTSSAQRGRGEARIRRGVRPWHVRRGWPRNLGGPRLSSKTLRWSGEPVTRLRRTARRGRTVRRAPAQKPCEEAVTAFFIHRSAVPEFSDAQVPSLNLVSVYVEAMVPLVV